MKKNIRLVDLPELLGKVDIVWEMVKATRKAAEEAKSYFENLNDDAYSGVAATVDKIYQDSRSRECSAPDWDLPEVHVIVPIAKVLYVDDTTNGGVIAYDLRQAVEKFEEDGEVPRILNEVLHDYHKVMEIVDSLTVAE